MSRRVAVVGTSFGARIHVPALRQAGFDVVALVGTDQVKTARRADRVGVPNGCTSLAAALALDVDAVSIASPPATHAALATEAMEGGCHVLCEKPFTLNAEEAGRLVELSTRVGRVGLLGHEFRWSPAQSTMAWALEQGLVGTPKLVLGISFISMLGEFAMPDWWFDPQRGGGWLGASGSHRIDNLLQWFGHVEAVSARLPVLSDPPLGIDDSFAIRCRLPGGTEAHLIQSAAAVGPPYSTNRVVGTSGTLWSEGQRVRLADRDDPGGRDLEVPPGAELPDVSQFATGALAEMTKTELPSYIRLAEAFRQAIDGAEPGAGPRAATFADGLACMKVLDAVRRSAANAGAWMEVG